MFSSRFNISLIFLLAIVFSSFKLGKTKTSLDFKKIDLIVIMNGSCAYHYNVDQNGTGTLLIGRSGNYSDSIFKFDAILKTINFKIKGKSKFTEYKNVVERIKSNSTITGTHNLDAWRCILEIDGQRRIDVYGTLVSKDFNELLTILSACKKTKIDPNFCLK